MVHTRTPTLGMRTAPEDVADYLAEVFVGMVGEDAAAVHPHMVRRLGEGRPVDVGALAAELGRPAAELDALLERFGVERDETGRIVGAGLSLRPTRHRFAVGGCELHTWCALDALVFQSLLGKTAEVESPCPATGTTVRVRVGPKISSTHIRIRWLTAEPGWEVVRPSIAPRRVVVFWGHVRGDPMHAAHGGPAVVPLLLMRVRCR